ncbi:hypothetical protein [Tichowtungia aerotolerans]|uniref:Uncharacterized protein n=1 Tax=Tichowtungia aerotolerans TaxID=2697043 RepID=A0A6P1M992_9BACT|nr:hypothetical protein [Tichowtungia aerotolerans]QHI68156.1 hypothetical protein GT409_01395 [Tichowtungia aerotolerans]
MKKVVEMEDDDWGQVIDGVTCRAEEYERTVQYHESGITDGDILEVKDAREAKNIAEHYREIIRKIRGQFGNG